MALPLPLAILRATVFTKKSCFYSRHPNSKDT